MLASKVVSELDCDGGGEEATAGIALEDTAIFGVLDILNKSLNMLS